MGKNYKAGWIEAWSVQLHDWRNIPWLLKNSAARALPSKAIAN